MHSGGHLKAGVWNQWNGMVEWTTGMEYWNGLGQDIFVLACNLKH